MQANGAASEWAESRKYLQAVLQQADDRAAAAAYMAIWHHYPLDFFHDTGTKRRTLMLKAFDNGDGWAARLASSVPDLCRYNLHTKDLGLPAECKDATLLLDPANIRLWRSAIEAHLSGPLYWTLELGENGRIHCHVLASANAGLLHIPRGGKVVQVVGNDLEAHVTYVCKAKAPWIVDNLATYLRAKRKGRLPRLSGTMRLPNRRSWLYSAEASAGHPRASVFRLGSPLSFDPLKLAAGARSSDLQPLACLHSWAVSPLQADAVAAAKPLTERGRSGLIRLLVGLSSSCDPITKQTADAGADADARHPLTRHQMAVPHPAQLGSGLRRASLPCTPAHRLWLPVAAQAPPLPVLIR